MKHAKYLILLVAAGLGSITLAFKEDLFLVSKNIDIFAALYKEVSINYVEETNPVTFLKKGIDAMLNGLDPYTEYIPESEIENYKLKYVSTQYGGLGLSTIIIDNKLYVNELTSGNPAQKQGLLPGDEILKINEIDVQGKDRTQISQLLRGPRGTLVTLLINRAGNQLKKSIAREEIKQPNVSYSGMLADNIGYIKLDKFLEQSGQEVKDALVNLNKNNPQGIILDLRNNGGGILQEAVKIVNLFVRKEVLVVVQKGRNPNKTVNYKTLTDPIAPDVPLVVLINESSASASEIVAGALQDLDRAVIIGQRSYGKGLVQQTFNLPYNSLVKVTVAKYYTPSGRCIQKLDYAHKDIDGVAFKMPDSLILSFNTTKGRKVYSGNGVFPDLATEANKLSPFTINVFNKNLYFDYVNAFYKKNKSIAEAKNFKLSNMEFEEFTNSLLSKDLSYISATDRILKQLNNELGKENRLDDFKDDLQSFKNKLAISGKSAINKNKDDLKHLVEMMIVSRYYFERGKIEQSFQYDKEITQATVLFNNPKQILAIVNGDGSFKNIGELKN